MQQTDWTAALDMLRKIVAELEHVNKRIDQIMEAQERPVPAPKAGTRIEKPIAPEMVLDVMTLLSLPDHLRKTATVACNLGEATADDVARETKRARAAESNYLNQLVTMGHLNKKKRGRQTYFYASP